MVFKSRNKILNLTGIWIVLAFFTVNAQFNLEDRLKEEESYYQNYGISGYSKAEIEQQKVAYYDLFGVHITNGWWIYSIENFRDQVYEGDNKPYTDFAKSTEMSARLMHEGFNNLIMTSDAIGNMKSVFQLQFVCVAF